MENVGKRGFFFFFFWKRARMKESQITTEGGGGGREGEIGGRNNWHLGKQNFVLNTL